MAEQAKPWEPLEVETSKAYEAFSIYRDMGISRTLTKVAEELQKSDTLIARWSRTHNWVERAAAWDAEQDRIMREEQVQEIKKMRKRHAEMAYSMIIKAAKALKRIPYDEIKAADISRMVEVGSKLERISRGDVGEVIEERNGGDAPPAVTFYMPDNGRGKKEEE